MGSQELHIGYKYLINLLDSASIKDYKKDVFLDLKTSPERTYCSARFLYSLLNIHEYHCVDLNQEHGSIPHNYNNPLTDTTLYGKFDIVTDHGSCEHAFNIAECYRTMHRLCKPGGLLIIAQALWGGNGYFLYDARFFSGIAAANNYKIIFNSYTVNTNDYTDHGSILSFHIPMHKNLLQTINFNQTSEIGVYAVLQKQNDDDFKYPYQGCYLNDSLKVSGFNRLFMQNSQSYLYIPTAKKSIYNFSKEELLK